MGMLNVEMKEGIRFLFEGHLQLGDQSSPYIRSLGTIFKKPSIGDKYVDVLLDDGPNMDKSYVYRIPTSGIFWINQGK